MGLVQWELEGTKTDYDQQGAAMYVLYNNSLDPLCRNRQRGPPRGAVVQPHSPDRRSAPAVSIYLVCVFECV